MATRSRETHLPYRPERNDRSDRYSGRRFGCICLLAAMGLTIVAAAGSALPAGPAAAVDGGAIANSEPAPPAQLDAAHPAAQSAPPGASDSRPAMTQPVRPSRADANVRNAQILLASLKETFQAGQVEAQYGEGSSRDSRMEILCILIADKIPYVISKRIGDASEREAALAEARKTQEYVDKILVPAFNKAKESRKSDDARGLVALMDELNGHLTGLHKVVSAVSSVGATPRPVPGPQQGSLPGGVSSASDSASAARMPRAAATEPSDDWTRYVQEFIRNHDLDDVQQQLAWSILKEFKARAQEHQLSHRSEYQALGDMRDKAQRPQSLLALDKPLRDMFDELKGRLDGILTQAQRKTGSPVGPGRATGR